MNYRTMEIYKRIKELYDGARVSDRSFNTCDYEWIIGRQIVDLMTNELRDYLIVDKDLPTNDNTLMGIRVTIDYNHTCRIGLYKESSKLRELKEPEEQRKTVYISTRRNTDDDWLTKALKDELNMRFGLQPGRGGFTYFKPIFDVDESAYPGTIKPLCLTMPRHVGRSAALQFIDEMHMLEKCKNKAPEIDRVIYNNPATIVFWKDGTKTVVKAQDEAFDEEKGLAMAIAKKVYGNDGRYFDKLKKHLPKIEKEKVDPGKSRCTGNCGKCCPVMTGNKRKANLHCREYCKIYENHFKEK